MNCWGHTLSLVDLSQPLFISQELFKVVISRELNLILKVTVFSLNLSGSSVPNLPRSMPCNEAPSPLLNHCDSFGLNLKFLSLLALNL